MERRMAIKYLICDLASAAVAWALLFVFRKIALEGLPWSQLSTMFDDANFWWGIVVVPIGWVLLYFMQGTYRKVLRKSRLK